MQVTAISDETGYYTITVTPVEGSGNPPFSKAEECVLEFNRTGDKGTQGTTGTQGTQGNQGNQGTTGTQGSQ